MRVATRRFLCGTMRAFPEGVLSVRLSSVTARPSIKGFNEIKKGLQIFLGKQ